jgi:hypothetical protein
MRTLWLRLCAWIAGWWKRRFHRPRRPQSYQAVHVADSEQLPQQLSGYIVYIIGLEGNEWLAEMVCPCGCGAIVFLNLLQDEFPNWKWHVNADGNVTLSPSVWRTVGCKSHFYLRNGEIQWCGS